MRPIVSDLLEIAGLLVLAYGCSLIVLWLGVITLGLGLIALGFLLGASPGEDGES